MSYIGVARTMTTGVSLMARVHQISAHINTFESLDALAEYVLSECSATVNADAAALFLSYGPHGTFELFKCFSNNGLQNRRRFGIGDDEFLGLFSVNHMDNEGSRRESFIWRNDGIIEVPLWAHNECIGVIRIKSKASERYTCENEVECLPIIANHTAVAIKHLQRSEELRHQHTTEKTLGRETKHLLLKEYREHILENLHIGICVLDSSNTIVLWNKEIASSVGIPASKAVGEKCCNVFSILGLSSICDVVERVMKTGVAETLEYVDVATANGVRKNVVRCSASPLYTDNTVSDGVVLFFDDVTERITLEKELRINERLALIGKMASGIAHELNNPLDGTRRYINLSLAKLEHAGDEHRLATQKYLESAKDGINRIIKVVRSLLEFSRQTNHHECRYTDLTETVTEAWDMVKERAHHRNVVLSTDIVGDIPPIVDYSILTVFVNLFMNAIDAMPNGGTITLTARAVAHGKNVTIQIADTGTGIAPEYRDKIFDPFFTTKASGEGTGLGLSLSYEIIRRSGGTMSVASVVNEGTVFTIELPCNHKQEK